MPNGWHGSTRRATLPPNWKTIRARVLDRDERRCQIRGPRCTGYATDVDHIADRDNHTPGNLRAACHACHQHRSSSQGGHAAQASRSPRTRTPEPHPGLITTPGG